MDHMISLNKAIKYMIITLAVILLVLIWPLKMLRIPYTAKSDEIVAKAVEASGKKTIKDLNVYYQPEFGKVYFTADDIKGEFDL